MSSAAYLHVFPGRVGEGLELAVAGGAGRDVGAGAFGEPGVPIGPPGAFGFGGALEPVLDAVLQMFGGPELVFVRVGVIDHAGDVARPRDDELDRAAEGTEAG